MLLDNLNNIPKELRDLNIWLCYDDRVKPSYSDLTARELDDMLKKPRDLRGRPASINFKLNSFNECIESIKAGYNSGLGIVVKNNGIVVIDYDNCFKSIEENKTYSISKPIFNKDQESRILRDINLMSSYTEISPSGKGLHIYFISNTCINTKTKDIEIYSNHYIRLSGNQYFFNELEDRTEQLDQLLTLYNINIDKLDPKTESKTNIINTRYNYYSDLLNKQFITSNTYTDKEILATMLDSKKGNYLKKLFYNEITDTEYTRYKTDKLDRLLKSGTITNETYNKLFNTLDTSNSGKSFTLIMELLHFCYGDLKAVKSLFIKSPLCKKDYLDLSYAKNYKTGKYTKDKIDYCFIPKAIHYYKNYTL